MTTIQSATLPELQRRLKSVQRELEAAEPVRMQEFLLLQDVISQRQTNSPGSEYASIRSTQKAVRMVLMERGDFMTKQAIYDRLCAGGFEDAMTEEVKWTINDCINYYLRTKFLVKRGEGTGWDAEVGFPQFASSSNLLPTT